jgi:hypothetical protein
MTGHKVLIKDFPLITIFIVLLILDLALIKLMILFLYIVIINIRNSTQNNLEGQRKGI